MNTAAIAIVAGKDLAESFFSVRRLSKGLDIVPVIIEDVRLHGDSAIRNYASKFDRANPETFEISKEDLKNAEEKLCKETPDLYKALIVSRDLALEFAKRQRASFEDFEVSLSPGLITGQKNIAVEKAGVYVPAGRFPLISSVIMGSVPALAAGVSEIFLCTPPLLHPENPALPWGDERILAAASICGIDRVFAVGGAQAIAAMAYGTTTIPKVNVIVGPGNKYVAAAKKLVYGDVGIDLVAGPTEVLIIADSSAHPKWVAADLLAQAEHDSDAQAILITTSESLAIDVQAEVTRLVQELPPEAAARKSFTDNSVIIVVNSLKEAVEIANRKAPEHLELAMDPGPEREDLSNDVRNYGSLFIGHRSAEVLGDYTAGLNHTLPTSGSAMFTGGLSVRHFLKTVTTLRVQGEDSIESHEQVDISGWTASLEAAEQIALAEGLTGHALAARCRLS